MQVRELITIISARWRTMLVSVLLVVGVTMVVTYFVPPVYESRARFYLTSPVRGGSSVSSADMTTYIELLGSPVFLEPLREALGDRDTPLSLTGIAVGGPPIIEVVGRSPSAKLAAEAANATGPQLAKIGNDFSPVTTASGEVVKATVLRPAAVPDRPLTPDPVLNGALALLAGLGLGVGAILTRHFLDTKIRTEADIQAISDRPLLAGLRRIRNTEGGLLVVADAPHSPAAEEFRRLRTNLQFVDVTTGERHSFVVTSASAGEGKTTTAINLALALADAGAEVLLVDADLRNPSVASAMGLEGSVGLTTVLLRRATADEATQQWRDTSLFVLASGTRPPNPSELLGSEAMRRLLGSLLAQYDYVIVDSPPVGPVIDPVLISRLVGGLLLVVSNGQTGKRELAAALRQLATVKVEVSGFALNLVDGGSGYYRYGDGPSGGSAPAVLPAVIGEGEPQRAEFEASALDVSYSARRARAN